MRLAIPLLLLMLLSGCVNLASEPAICEGTVALRKAHAGALLADGGTQSQVTGERLLSGMKAGCGE